MVVCMGQCSGSAYQVQAACESSMGPSRLMAHTREVVDDCMGLCSGPARLVRVIRESSMGPPWSERYFFWLFFVGLRTLGFRSRAKTDIMSHCQFFFRIGIPMTANMNALATKCMIAIGGTVPCENWSSSWLFHLTCSAPDWNGAYGAFSPSDLIKAMSCWWICCHLVGFLILLSPPLRFYRTWPLLRS